ncbi:hypothetical protein ENH_00005050 [Eimeria necatrix]|uniref:Uncharacterized protein n=1 Tax=Eimeria necatrix TaxID=51315 RepID=U6MSJ2_9EIME|nr:hypothetical protein ENH_00005050 [Eimeria necatrix]CDJ65449.1 hypothetical protein ENH_00005050 [Eimeria necatrix]
MDAESCLSRLSDSHLKAQARAWLAADRNPQTLAQARQLLQEAPEEELKEIFCKHLVFGTVSFGPWGPLGGPLGAPRGPPGARKGKGAPWGPLGAPGGPWGPLGAPRTRGAPRSVQKANL